MAASNLMGKFGPITRYKTINYIDPTILFIHPSLDGFCIFEAVLFGGIWVTHEGDWRDQSIKYMDAI